MNSYLEDIVKCKLGKKENETISKDDLESITELGINNLTFSDKPKNISLDELVNFPNLEILTLQHFDLSESDLKVLEGLKRLKSLNISSCSINGDTNHEFPNLEVLAISTSKFKDLSIITFPKSATIRSIKSVVDISTIVGLENIEQLILNNIKIKNIEILKDMPYLIYLNLDGSIVDNQEIVDGLKEKISVSQEKNFFLM